MTIGAEDSKRHPANQARSRTTTPRRCAPASRKPRRRFAPSGSGEVDAVIVMETAGGQVFTLTGAEQPYRQPRRADARGRRVLTSRRGHPLLQPRFAQLVAMPLEGIVGGRVRRFVADADRERISDSIYGAGSGAYHGCLVRRAGARPVAVSLSLTTTVTDGVERRHLIVADLSELWPQRPSASALRPTTARRTSSSRCSRTNCAIRWARSRAPSTCSRRHTRRGDPLALDDSQAGRTPLPAHRRVARRRAGGLPARSGWPGSRWNSLDSFARRCSVRSPLRIAISKSRRSRCGSKAIPCGSIR